MTTVPFRSTVPSPETRPEREAERPPDRSGLVWPCVPVCLAGNEKGRKVIVDLQVQHLLERIPASLAGYFQPQPALPDRRTGRRAPNPARSNEYAPSPSEGDWGLSMVSRCPFRRRNARIWPDLSTSNSACAVPITRTSRMSGPGPDSPTVRSPPPSFRICCSRGRMPEQPEARSCAAWQERRVKRGWSLSWPFGEKPQGSSFNRQKKQKDRSK